MFALNYRMHEWFDALVVSAPRLRFMIFLGVVMAVSLLDLILVLMKVLPMVGILQMAFAVYALLSRYAYMKDLGHPRTRLR